MNSCVFPVISQWIKKIFHIFHQRRIFSKPFIENLKWTVMALLAVPMFNNHNILFCGNSFNVPYNPNTADSYTCLGFNVTVNNFFPKYELFQIHEASHLKFATLFIYTLVCTTIFGSLYSAIRQWEEDLCFTFVPFWIHVF